MNFLIINNGTSYLDNIVSLLKGHTFEVFSFNDKKLPDCLNKFDAVILSGGHALTLNDHKNDFTRETDIVLNSQLPIFGICFGFQLIALAYGSKLEEMQKSEKGIIKIKKDNTDDILRGINDKFEVFENHRRVIKEVSDFLLPLAHSDDGIEIIKHKNKKIYGVQFHPEMFVEKTNGDEIFLNFLSLIK